MVNVIHCYKLYVCHPHFSNSFHFFTDLKVSAQNRELRHENRDFPMAVS